MRNLSYLSVFTFAIFISFLIFSAYAATTTIPKTCSGYCGKKSISNCWCDSLCTKYGDCCPDYQQYCGGSATTTTIPTTKFTVTHSPLNPAVSQSVNLKATIEGPAQILPTIINITLDNLVVKSCASSPCTYSKAFTSPGTHAYYAEAFFPDPLGMPTLYYRNPTIGANSFTVSSSVTTITGNLFKLLIEFITRLNK